MADATNDLPALSAIDLPMPDDVLGTGLVLQRFYMASIAPGVGHEIRARFTPTGDTEIYEINNEGSTITHDWVSLSAAEFAKISALRAMVIAGDVPSEPAERPDEL